MRVLWIARFFVIAAGVCSCATPGWSAATPQTGDGPALSSMEARGSIGPYSVGLNYTVRQNTQLVTAHYFYASHLTNIALQGAVHGESVDLTGADGSVFHLHLVGNGSSGKEALTFYTAVGFRGTWTLGKQSYPVTLDGGYSTANPGERMYADVTAKPDQAFEAMVAKLRQAILAGDQNAAVALVHFPLRVHRPQQKLSVRNAAELKAAWANLFTPSFLAKLRTDVPHEMFVHDGLASLGDGELWFDDQGLVSLNLGPKGSK